MSPDKTAAEWFYYKLVTKQPDNHTHDMMVKNVRGRGEPREGNPERGRGEPREGNPERGNPERETERDTDLHTLGQQPLHTTADDGVAHAADSQLVVVQKLVNEQSDQGATLRGVNGVKAP